MYWKGRTRWLQQCRITTLCDMSRESIFPFKTSLLRNIEITLLGGLSFLVQLLIKAPRLFCWSKKKWQWGPAVSLRFMDQQVRDQPPIRNAEPIKNTQSSRRNALCSSLRWGITSCLVKQLKYGGRSYCTWSAMALKREREHTVVSTCRIQNW